MCSLNMRLLSFYIRGEQVFFPTTAPTSSASRARSPSAASGPSSRSTAPRCSRRSGTCYGPGILEPPHVVNFVLHTPTQDGARCTPYNLHDMGMEDNVLYRRGEPVHDNAQLVERAVRIAAELDRRPATPDEARRLLALRGRAYAAVAS